MKICGKTSVAILLYTVIFFIIVMIASISILSESESLSLSSLKSVSASVFSLSVLFGIWFLKPRYLENDRIALILVHILACSSIVIFLFEGVIFIKGIEEFVLSLFVYRIMIYLGMSILVAIKYFILINRRYPWYNILNRIFWKKDMPSLTDLGVKHERKVRKQWLITLFISMVGSILYLYSMPSVLNEFVEIIGFVVFALVIGRGIRYYFSYKRNGTSWLMLDIIILPLNFWWVISNYFKVPPGPIGWIISAFFLLIIICYWVNCLRLYSINASREYQRELLKNS